MCGIAGVRRFDGRPLEQGLVEAVAARLRHRSPVGAGAWAAGSTQGCQVVDRTEGGV